MSKGSIILRRRKDIFFGVFGGIIIYIPLVFNEYVLCITSGYRDFLVFSFLSYSIGILISIATILIKSEAPKNTGFRAIVMLISLFIVSVINVYIGTLFYIDNLLGIQENEFSGAVRAISSLFYIIAIIITCIITTIVFAFIKKLKAG